jgi:hypothetical protein
MIDLRNENNPLEETIFFPVYIPKFLGAIFILSKEIGVGGWS